MARKLEDIWSLMLSEKENRPELDVLSSNSKTAIWRSMIDIVAFAIWLLETIFDTHRAEIDEALLERTPHTRRWYRNKAKDFQYGFALLSDTDKFDNTGATDEEIEQSKIVRYAAVIENEEQRRLIVKIATEAGGQLQPIDSGQEVAFRAYIAEIKDAGVPITIVNYLPDTLHLTIRIFRDPMVIDENGTDIRDGSRPVEVAINEFLKELPFNGELILQELSNKLETIEGVMIVQIDNAEVSWEPSGGEADSAQSGFVDVSAIPVSGYFQIDNFNDISYVVRN